MRSDLHLGEFEPQRLPATGFIAALQTSVRVWQAVMLRETRTRFGRTALGFLWALLEPALFIAMFLSIRVIIKVKFPAFGDNFALFMASGIIVVRYYTAIAGRSLAAISSNRALLTYPIVRIPDVIIARALLETVTMLLVTLIFWVMISLIEVHRVIHHPLTFAAGLAVTTFLAWGVGIFNAVLAALWQTWQRIYPLLSLPIMITSGIFYLPVTMPEDAKRILAWNPVLHCVEWIRTGIYLDYMPVLDQSYPILFGAIAMTIGLALEKLFRRVILRS